MNDDWLKRIANIPWAERKTATGDARQVPQALKELLSSDAEVRERAYWKIDNHVVLQSDLYEAAYDVIPFLIDIVRERNPHGRELAYDLLFEIANGHAPADVQCITITGETLPLQKACGMALGAGHTFFERDATDSDATVRSKAVELIERLTMTE